MNTYKVLIFSIFLFLGCSTTKPYSNYEQDLTLPKETENFMLVDKQVFEEPELGMMVRYIDKVFPEDNITVYIYPIRNIQWDDQESTLNKEMDYIFSDIDLAIQEGFYKSRSEDKRSEFMVNASTQPYTGIKASFTLTDKDDVFFYSDNFLFIAEDKYIKFRTSFDSRMNKELTGDEIVKELLPLIKVPAESPYMQNKRMVYKQKIQEDFLKLLIESIHSSKLFHLLQEEYYALK